MNGQVRNRLTWEDTIDLTLLNCINFHENSNYPGIAVIILFIFLCRFYGVCCIEALRYVIGCVYLVLLLHNVLQVMREVGWVVFDEIHYMRDPGTVCV